MYALYAHLVPNYMKISRIPSLGKAFNNCLGFLFLFYFIIIIFLIWPTVSPTSFSPLTLGFRSASHQLLILLSLS
jgi:hypothetical protein